MNIFRAYRIATSPCPLQRGIGALCPPPEGAGGGWSMSVFRFVFSPLLYVIFNAYFYANFIKLVVL